MRSACWILAAGLLLSATGAAELSPPEALLDRHIEAYNRADAQALASLYAEDGRVFAADGRVIRGRPEISKYWELELKKLRRRTRMGAEERETSGGIAYLIGNYSFERSKERGTFTMCFKRGGDGSWKIVASMWNEGPPRGYTPLR